MFFHGKSSPGFFEARYKQAKDPWNFSQDQYEQARFERIVAALSHRRYARALEPGCSIGTLTERLAKICEIVDASDFSPTATERARERCAALPNVRVTCAALSAKTQVSGYDLIVFSEIGYYFRASKWRSMVADLAASMDSGATILASHWLGQSNHHRQGGDEVHETLRAEPLLQLEYAERNTGFRLDRFTRL